MTTLCSALFYIRDQQTISVNNRANISGFLHHMVFIATTFFLSLQPQSIHTQSVKKCSICVLIKLYCLQNNSWLDLAAGCSLPNPILGTESQIKTVGASGKESACQYRRHKRCRFDPWVGKIPWKWIWQPTPVFWSELSF